MSMLPKRTRRPAETGEYSDPLKQFGTMPPPADELERHLTAGTVAEMSVAPIATIPISTNWPK